MPAWRTLSAKAVEQLAIQRFVAQLVVQTASILVRNQVVAGLNVADFFADHLLVDLETIFGRCRL